MAMHQILRRMRRRAVGDVGETGARLKRPGRGARAWKYSEASGSRLRVGQPAFGQMLRRAVFCRGELKPE